MIGSYWGEEGERVLYIRLLLGSCSNSPIITYKTERENFPCLYTEGENFPCQSSRGYILEFG